MMGQQLLMSTQRACVEHRVLAGLLCFPLSQSIALITYACEHVVVGVSDFVKVFKLLVHASRRTYVRSAVHYKV